MVDIGAGTPDEQPEMSLLELEEAAGDEAHPRHEEAKRILEHTVAPFLDNLHRSILPTLRGGFSRSGGSDSDEPGLLNRPGHELRRNAEQVQRQVEAAIEAQHDEIAREKAAEQAQREEDRAESRRQHRVMLGWTIASFSIAVFATVIAVVALFVSGG
ncbi:hypothetical protein AB0O90_04470 [Microbacterium testaceum]|uniref:hypothetical protein n=1 Tax=Microbacterium testaceum TaxID=2033 RepID=UPI00344AA395